MLQNENLLKHLVNWSAKSECAINSEAGRLICWLLKNAFRISKEDIGKVDITLLEVFINVEGTLEVIIKMLTSNHVVMQNEALIALTIISTAYYQEKSEFTLDEQFIKYDLCKNLEAFIKRNSESMSKEIADNLQILMKLLLKSECMRNDLEKHCVAEALKSIPSYTNYCTL